MAKKKKMIKVSSGEAIGPRKPAGVAKSRQKTTWWGACPHCGSEDTICEKTGNRYYSNDGCYILQYRKCRKCASHFKAAKPD